ncbi:unnamed protein product [Notodromas monacha]|uniref:Phosphatidylinositol 3-kinase catalytic subunit type 3 n=1 Tax=Notodromas monacha TaxID=399045 RepID=A0A7R9BED0_9CRUS|nr:unnamed protein product [Notodromas monacha]CAG0913122.1 unnamed protein product [Notodromas monacha]
MAEELAEFFRNQDMKERKRRASPLVACSVCGGVCCNDDGARRMLGNELSTSATVRDVLLEALGQPAGQDPFLDRMQAELCQPCFGLLHRIHDLNTELADHHQLLAQLYANGDARQDSHTFLVGYFDRRRRRNENDEVIQSGEDDEGNSGLEPIVDTHEVWDSMAGLRGRQERVGRRGQRQLAGVRSPPPLLKEGKRKRRLTCVTDKKLYATANESAQQRASKTPRRMQHFSCIKQECTTSTTTNGKAVEDCLSILLATLLDGGGIDMNVEEDELQLTTAWGQAVCFLGGSLEGAPTRVSYEDVLGEPELKMSGRYVSACCDLYVECSVFADGRPVAFPVQTGYKPFTNRWSWNEWVWLPVKWCDLPRSAVLCLTVWDCHGPGKRAPVGGTTLSLFGAHGQLREGIRDLKVWRDVEADGGSVTSTPGKLVVEDGHQEMRRLSKLVKKHRSGRMQRVDWLDRMTFREIELINEREKRATNEMYLVVEFPRFEFNGVQYTIVYFEPDGEEVFQARGNSSFSVVADFEMFQENLVEAKHQKLARSLRSGLSDRDLKPNSGIRDALQRITLYPPTQHLTPEEQDLVWRYRFYLTANKKALSKFLQCVPWGLRDACKQAGELLTQWSPPDPEDALELLGPKFDAYTAQRMVRKYAVLRLKEAPDDDLLLYLLQLDFMTNRSMSVEKQRAAHGGAEATNGLGEQQQQTLQRAIIGDGDERRDAEGVEFGFGPDLDLASFLIHRSCHNTVLASYLHWYLLIECEDPVGGSPTPATWSSSSTSSVMATTAITASPGAGNTAFSALSGKGYGEEERVTVPAERGAEDTGREDMPDLNISKPQRIDSQAVRNMYLAIMRRFQHALMKGGKECRCRRSLLAKQQHFVDKLVGLMKTIARESGNRRKKIERLRSLLSDPQSHKLNLSSFDPLPFPLDPGGIKIVGVVPEKSSLFKSSLMPAKLAFRTIDNTDVVAIFKHGDDLRQDQLILQMIILMDKLMRRDHLDLKLTPYRVLATSTKHGFVQYVESAAIAEILNQDGSIQNFLRKHNPSDTGPYGIATEVMDNYVRSCAGYCIITYLLGVGDRHLDNLLLTTSGRLFHIDFGYILGRDPKPMPPPMKLSREMVEAMGGPGSDQYQEFKSKCFTSFLYLRRHANLIINLFALMVDANVPDIALEPDKTVRKVQDKFCLGMSDEEAVQYIQGIIDESVSAVMPMLVEQIHKFAQYWRK